MGNWAYLLSKACLFHKYMDRNPVIPPYAGVVQW